MTEVTAPLNDGGAGACDQSEQVRAIEDVYGRPIPERELAESRLHALENEVCRLPEDEYRGKSAVLTALRMNPLLFASSAHTVLVLREEEFDPKQGARRMARYWEQRERFFGEKAFDMQVFNNPTRADYLNYYEKCAKILERSDSKGESSCGGGTGRDRDEMTDHRPLDDTCGTTGHRPLDDEDETDESHHVIRNIAYDYVESVNEAKIAALDRILSGAAHGGGGDLHPRALAAWAEAKERNPSLADSDEHKLQFLRCEGFAERKAAARLCRYWTTKRKLFGPDAFHRSVTLDDLRGCEFELRLGAMRLMPGTDNSGRCVIANSMCQLAQEGWTIDGLSKVVWYVCHAALERDSCRANGIVMFANHRGTSRKLFGELTTYRHIAKSIVMDCVPVKICAGHHFFDRSRWWQKGMVKIAARVGKVFKRRIVVYLGRDEENLAKLEQFGISRDSVPTDLGGAVCFDDWSAWLDERQALEL